MDKIAKPIIVRKGSKSQNRINLPVTSNFNIGDEVAVITYTDYLATVEAGANDVTEELEKSKNTIKELELKIAELEKTNKDLLTSNNEIKTKISRLTEELTEEIKANSNNSSKLASLEAELKGLNDLITAKELAYSNGINSIINLAEKVIISSNEEIVNKANEVIANTQEIDLEKVNSILSKSSILSRLRGVTISPDEIATAKVTGNDLDLPNINSKVIKELKESKPLYKLE